MGVAKDSKNLFRAMSRVPLFRASVPGIGHFDLFVEFFLRGVESFAAGRAADGRLGLDEIIAAADAGRQYAVARLHVVVELCAAVAASDRVGCSHRSLVFSGSFFLRFSCRGRAIVSVGA